MGKLEKEKIRMPQLSVLVMLGICSYEDLKNRRICAGWLAIFAAEGLLYWMFCKGGLSVGIIKAMLPGLLLLLLAVGSKGGIGCGDGLLFMVIGIFMGGDCVLTILLFAVILCGIYAFYLSVARKKEKKYEIAFVPFALVSFLLAERFGCL